MKATEANLLDLMGVAKMQFVIPVYQRVYSWSVKECEVLWDDVMRAGRDGASHFVGSALYPRVRELCHEYLASASD